MKIENVKKEFSIYDDNNEPIGLIHIQPNGKEDDVKISITLSESLTFNSIKEYGEFVEFINKNIER